MFKAPFFLNLRHTSTERCVSWTVTYLAAQVVNSLWQIVFGLKCDGVRCSAEAKVRVAQVSKVPTTFSKFPSRMTILHRLCEEGDGGCETHRMQNTIDTKAKTSSVGVSAWGLPRILVAVNKSAFWIRSRWHNLSVGQVTLHCFWFWNIRCFVASNTITPFVFCNTTLFIKLRFAEYSIIWFEIGCSHYSYSAILRHETLGVFFSTEMWLYLFLTVGGF